MHRHLLLLATITGSWLPIWAAAQTSSRPPKPYSPIAITRPTASDDASFIAFRHVLAAGAKRRIYAELTPLVRTQRFFWDRDFGRKFDPRRPAVDNFATAIALEKNNGAGWDTLATFAMDDTAEPLESRPGVICAPARPDYDTIAFAKVLDVTDTTEIDWAYPRDEATPVRDAPQPRAAILGVLGAQLVRLLAYEGAGGNHSEPWARVTLPDGNIGYVAPGSLISLTGARLCYIKEPIAGWRIAGIIAAKTKPDVTEPDPPK